MEWKKIKIELPKDETLHEDYVQGLNNLLIQFRKEGEKSNANMWFRYNTRYREVNRYGENVSGRWAKYYQILIDNLGKDATNILKDLGYHIETISITRFERKAHYIKLDLTKNKWYKRKLKHGRN